MNTSKIKCFVLFAFHTGYSRDREIYRIFFPNNYKSVIYITNYKLLQWKFVGYKLKIAARRRKELQIKNYSFNKLVYYRLKSSFQPVFFRLKVLPGIDQAEIFSSNRTETLIMRTSCKYFILRPGWKFPCNRPFNIIFPFRESVSEFSPFLVFTGWPMSLKCRSQSYS